MLKSRRTVLIAGALTGIGRAVAAAFAQNGFNVVVSGRDEERGESLVKQVREFKIEADYLFADVRYEEDVRNLVDWTNIRFGGLDVAVNIAEAAAKSVEIVDQPAADFDAVTETNIRGTFLCLKHEMRVMFKQKGGVIINVLSTCGRHGATGCAPCAASRYAVEGLTKAAAHDAENKHVRVNAVATEYVGLDRFSLFADVSGKKSESFDESPERFVKPKEFAQMILMLASEKSSFTNGQIIECGGRKL